VPVVPGADQVTFTDLEGSNLCLDRFAQGILNLVRESLIVPVAPTITRIVIVALGADQVTFTDLDGSICV